MLTNEQRAHDLTILLLQPLVHSEHQRAFGQHVGSGTPIKDSRETPTLISLYTEKYSLILQRIYEAFPAP